MLADSQQLIVFHVFTRSWASVCVSYFFVPVETRAPPLLKLLPLYICGERSDVKLTVGGCGIIRVFPWRLKDLMDVKIQSLDRVIEALSPVLGSELDRVVQETRDAVEQEFQARLDETIREANATTASVQAQAERTVEEAKEETRRQITAQLEQQFSERLEARTNELKNEPAEERAKLQDELGQWRMFAEAQRQLADAGSQPEMLERFLGFGESFADGLAVYVTRADGLALWKNKGKG